MIRLTVDDESRAMSTWPNKAALHVGVDVVYAPLWATHVWQALDAHLYYVNGIDFAQMPLTAGGDRLKQLC